MKKTKCLFKKFKVYIPFNRRLMIYALSMLLLNIKSIYGQCDFISDLLPPGWQNMEIEAKWGANSAIYNSIVSDLYDGRSFEGYILNVRWSEISRKYIDYYYDDNASTLMNNLNSLRHRTRYRSNAPNNDLNTLINATWTENWQKVQYKSDPFRYGATWFREETGNCKISDNECNCNDLNSIMWDNCVPSHPAIERAFQDNPSFNESNNGPRFTVVDYRYRIELLKGGVPYYEVSLDRIVDGATVEYEVELELVKSSKSLSDMDELFRLVGVFESTYSSLSPSIQSKGGISVPEDQWNKTLSYSVNSSRPDLMARNQITVQNATIFSSGDITVGAGKNVRILNSFHARPGSHFRAGILDCPSSNLKNAILNDQNYQNKDHRIILSENKDGIEVFIYPNPTRGSFTITTSADEIGYMSVYNANGTMIFAKELYTREANVSLEGRPKGLYFIKIQSGNEMVTKTILLMK